MSHNTRSRAAVVDSHSQTGTTKPANPPALNPPITLDGTRDGGDIDKSSQTELARPGNLVLGSENVVGVGTSGMSDTPTSSSTRRRHRGMPQTIA